ncbi:macro domain-containing protein [uncultured Desulfobacter sp.]|uniref:macro domain-containing protein n=1 Tax=uncultured Desulfobacter sp. TaxID=240139 RepID=UPI002AAB9A42|nr:macro domain-containing protein [uncultured Desulfobacter sp.]
MKCIKGDLIQLAREGQFDLIIHGCNCFCTMGAGIAKQIRTYFPEAWEADLATESGDRSKLGNYSKACVDTPYGQLYVINAYTQYHYSGNGVLVDYDAITKIFTSLKKQFSGSRMGYPKIGAGLAKGDWDIISRIIDIALTGENHTLVELV